MADPKVENPTDPEDETSESDWPEPPPFNPDYDLIGYIERGQRPAGTHKRAS